MLELQCDDRIHQKDLFLWACGLMNWKIFSYVFSFSSKLKWHILLKKCHFYILMYELWYGTYDNNGIWVKHSSDLSHWFSSHLEVGTQNEKVSMESFIMCVCYPNTLCKCAGILCDGSYIHLPRPCAWGCKPMDSYYTAGRKGKRREIKSVPFSVQGHGDKIIQNGTVDGNGRATDCGELR